MNKPLIGSCIFGQSGGPTAVINASAYGVFKAALESPAITNVYGAAHGIKGVLSGSLYDIGQEQREELELLMHTPSSELGSCRYKLKDFAEDDTDYRRILRTFQKYNVRYFFYNGGNDSMDTCEKISRYLKNAGYECRVMGIPKTIDNDLFGTDHCPGYGSAAKYIATSCAEIYKDTHVYDSGMVTVVEIMGRNTGWLAASSALASLTGAGPDLIYLPETAFDMSAFLGDIDDVLSAKNKCLVVASEGIRYHDGHLVAEAQASSTDGFGHEQLGGLASKLAATVKNHTNGKVRAIELSLLQRCGSHLASQTDIDEAVSAGCAAVEHAVSGESDMMVTLNRAYEDGRYRCHVGLLPLGQVANVEKKLPREWIKPAGNGVTEDFINYALPLIQGENQRSIVDGLPRFVRLKKQFV